MRQAERIQLFLFKLGGESQIGSCDFGLFVLTQSKKAVLQKKSKKRSHLGFFRAAC